jgi:hypothetical protein
MTVFPPTATGTDAGGVRRYNVAMKSYAAFVSPIKDGDEPASWWYPIFGITCPVTLAYGSC